MKCPYGNKNEQSEDALSLMCQLNLQMNVSYLAAKYSQRWHGAKFCVTSYSLLPSFKVFVLSKAQIFLVQCHHDHALTTDIWSIVDVMVN